MDRDPTLDTLLDLDGELMFIHPEGYWVRFEVKRVAATAARPHGLRYSLTLHAPDGERLVGFDNAHGVSTDGARRRFSERAHDHRHRFASVAAYDYKDAGALMADFWREVDAVLRSRGLIE